MSTRVTIYCTEKSYVWLDQVENDKIHVVISWDDFACSGLDERVLYIGNAKQAAGDGLVLSLDGIENLSINRNDIQFGISKNKAGYNYVYSFFKAAMDTRTVTDLTSDLNAIAEQHGMSFELSDNE